MKNQFAANLKTLRKERGLTQEQLAEVFDVTIGAVHKWEAGLSTPDMEMIMDIADFFDTSLDALTGFDLRDNRVKELATRLRKMIDTKDMSGISEAETALKKYPHSIDIVYECAALYLCFATLYKDNRKYYSRSRELYEQALRLLPTNTNPKINDVLLYSGLCNAYLGMNEPDKAIRIMETHNAGGIFNAELGSLLATVNRYDEADVYLSYGIIGHLGKMVSFMTGKALYYLHSGEYEEAKACLRLFLDTSKYFRKEGRICNLDKTDCIFLTGLALLELKLGNQEEAVKMMKKAKKQAEKFDQAPDYDAKNLRFYTINESCMTYDTTGDKTAIESIDYIVDFLKEKELSQLWKKIRK